MIDISGKEFRLQLYLGRYVIFILSNILIYLSYYKLAKDWNWELQIKTNSVHYRNITNLILLSTTIYVFGNYDNRWDWMMFFVTFASALGFGYLAEQPFLKTSVSADDIKKWSIKTKSFFIGVFALIFALAIYHIKLAFDKKIAMVYLIMFGLVMFVYLGLPYFIQKQENGVAYHPHHWTIFWILAIFTRFNTIISKVCAGICLGIYIQGSSMYNNDRFLGSIFDH